MPLSIYGLKSHSVNKEHLGHVKIVVSNFQFNPLKCSSISYYSNLYNSFFDNFSMKLLRFHAQGTLIFVGDTHGDRNVNEEIISRYLKPGNRIVFLGDYVDRGYDSKGNLGFLLDVRAKNPRQVYLLQGNHEGFRISNYWPADFWESLSQEEKDKYADILEKLPYAVSVEGIIAVHGALPDVKKLSDIEKIELGGNDWRALTWGDFVNSRNSYGEIRPGFTREYFDTLMKRFRKHVLIRSHDPFASISMYNGRCVTLFSTSSSIRKGRKTIAIADFNKTPKIRTIDDLVIREI